MDVHVLLEKTIAQALVVVCMKSLEIIIIGYFDDD
jgi:hypothetical protein